MSETSNQTLLRTQGGFLLGDLVQTIKGASFWGEIVAFDNDENLPGCTVKAIALGFEGIKHVYPLKQLALYTGDLPESMSAPNPEKFRNRMRVVYAAVAYVHSLGTDPREDTETKLIEAVKAYDKTA